jgi:hypothetical protein
VRSQRQHRKKWEEIGWTKKKNLSSSHSSHFDLRHLILFQHQNFSPVFVPRNDTESKKKLKI